VRYENIRPRIVSGDVLAWDSKGVGRWNRFLIWLGRLGQLTKFTHVGIAWVVGERVLIIDAVATGVRDYPLSQDLPCYLLSRNTPLTDKQLAFALAQKGEKYSYLECLWAWFGRNNPHDNFWQCSEFVCEVLDFDCEATPSAVVDYVMAQGAEMTLITE
jgi:hypothetical protein